MIIGFTGTRLGWTDVQGGIIHDFLTDQIQIDEFHHGDCVGSDFEAHKIVTVLGIETHVHPPINDSQRARCLGDVMYEPKPYLDRNVDIVDACDLLLATPAGLERVRSGTWSTIRYAKSQGKDYYIVYPDGRTTVMRKNV